MKITVQVNGPDDGFHGIRQDGFPAITTAFEFTGAQAQVLAELELPADFRQGHTFDHACPEAAQLAFPGFFEVEEQMFGDHHIHDRIAQKLQPLIVLVAVASVGQRQQQPFRFPELVADPAL